MYSPRYKQDRVEEVPPGTQAVAKKIEAIVQAFAVGYKQPPFISENGYIPLEVAKSVVMRRQSLWGRYE